MHHLNGLDNTHIVLMAISVNTTVPNSRYFTSSNGDIQGPYAYSLRKVGCIYIAWGGLGVVSVGL